MLTHAGIHLDGVSPMQYVSVTYATGNTDQLLL